jgi:hypothetical protein
MSITPEVLLKKLNPYNNRKKMLVYDQSTGDIIQAILNTHKQYTDEYKKIAHIFIGHNIDTTCRNIFDFVKKNIRYVVETEDNQFVRSPQAILTQKVSDCKCMSLFTGGICQALNIPFVYRFASYKSYDKNPAHVFIVVNPGTNNEIWVDPVLHSYNWRKPYHYKIDKKPKSMSVYQISGIGEASIGRRSRAERKARRNAGKGLRGKLKKALKKINLKGVLKLVGAPVRNAFLGLVALNVHGLGTNIVRAWAKNPDKLRNFWQSVGGNIDKLVKAGQKGARKKRILGTDPNPNIIGVAIPTLLASASPLIIKFTNLLKSIGINPKELVEVGAEALKRKAQEVLEDQIEPQVEQQAEYEEEAQADYTE